MAVSIEVQTRVAELRAKARDGTLTMEDMREGISLLRAERLAMPQGKPTSRKAPTPNADDLLSELGL